MSKLLIFFVLVFYSFSNSYAKPPYRGTIWDFPDIINSNDPTTFQELIYVGQDHREMFDRRKGGRWITKKVFLFNAIYEDRTIEIVKHFQQDPELNSEKSSNYTSIKIHYIKDYSPGKSLNLGVKCSSNDYILTLSSHCVVKKFNKAKHIKDLENHLCIFGNQIPIWEGKKINKRYIWSHFVNAEVVNMFSEMENRYFLHNGIAFYKKETLINYPFDPHLVGKEDRYWANNIIQKNYQF